MTNKNTIILITKACSGTINQLRRHTLKRRRYNLHQPRVGVKLDLVQRRLPVVPVAVGDGEAVVGNQPVVGAGDVDHAVVAGAQDPQLGPLGQHDAAVRPRPVGRRGRGVPDAVVLRPRVVDAVRQVVQAPAVHDEEALAEVDQALDRPGGVGLERHHVVAQLRVQRSPVAPVQVVPAADRVAERRRVDGLARRHGLVVLDEGVLLRRERSQRAVGHGGADGLGVERAVVAAVVEIELAVALREARRPGVAHGPRHVAARRVQRQDGLLAARPVGQVRRRPDVKLLAAPAGEAVGGGVDVVGLVVDEDVGVGVEPREHGGPDVGGADRPVRGAAVSRVSKRVRHCLAAVEVNDCSRSRGGGDAVDGGEGRGDRREADVGSRCFLLRGVREGDVADLKNVAGLGGHLVAGEGAPVQGKVAHLALEQLVRSVDGPADVVVGRDAVADAEGVGTRRRVAGDLGPVQVQDAGAAADDVGEVHPLVLGQVALLVGGLLSAVVAGGNGGTVGAARGKDVAVARAAGAGVAQAKEEVGRLLAGVDADTHLDAHVLDVLHQVKGKRDEVVLAVKGHDAVLDAGAAEDLGVGAVARLVGEDVAVGEAGKVVLENLAGCVDGTLRVGGASQLAQLRGRDRDDGSVARAAGQAEVGRDPPLRRGNVGRLQRDVATAAILIDKQVPLLAVDIARVGLEGRGTLDGRGARVAPDAGGDLSPRSEVRTQGGGALLDDVGTAGAAGPLVLGEAVVGVAVLDDGRVDARHAGVLPDLCLAEGDKVAGGDVQHAVVRRTGAAGVVGRVERRGPKDNVLPDRWVKEGLGGPCVAGLGRGHEHVALGGPVDEVGRLPHLEVAAAKLDRVAPRSSRPDGKVGGDQEELVTLGRPDDEGIPQALGAHGRLQRGLAAVQLAPAQGIVAHAGGKVDLFALDAVAGEIGKGVTLKRKLPLVDGLAHVGGEVTLDRDASLLDRGPERDRPVRILPLDYAVVADDLGVAAVPRHREPVPGPGEVKVSADVLDVGDGNRGEGGFCPSKDGAAGTQGALGPGCSLADKSQGSQEIARVVPHSGPTSAV
ncbi:hypothetical protein PpBr36_02202 [Pyricularia pennisetigena]|uniref:hypothetical protein n=1 Tax=Pyricularia pennisetigena TaxID=1578925 RepID=UPI00114F45A1|nr:hypothetical protein PpBr36_02202 [Pyricularia pennisetigena]TLS29904.1 hypothetical protein PpBr36_02202 [Pyricularia pennisetigena]